MHCTIATCLSSSPLTHLNHNKKIISRTTNLKHTVSPFYQQKNIACLTRRPRKPYLQTSAVYSFITTVNPHQSLFPPPIHNILNLEHSANISSKFPQNFSTIYTSSISCIIFFEYSLEDQKSLNYIPQKHAFAKSLLQSFQTHCIHYMSYVLICF